jgi:hypothetical protein
MMMFVSVATSNRGYLLRHRRPQPLQPQRLIVQ